MPAQRKTTTQRGLGYSHRKQTDALKRKLVDGTPCWWCGKGLYRSQELDGDHSQPRAHGGKVTDRLLHRTCNNERGDGSRDHLRPALGPPADAQDGGEQSESRSRWCVLQW